MNELEGKKGVRAWFDEVPFKWDYRGNIFPRTIDESGELRIKDDLKKKKK